MHQIRFQLGLCPRPSRWILGGPTSKKERGVEKGRTGKVRGVKKRKREGRDDRGKEREKETRPLPIEISAYATGRGLKKVLSCPWHQCLGL